MHDPMSVGEKTTAIKITGTTTMTITLRLATEKMVEKVEKATKVEKVEGRCSAEKWFS